MIDMSTDPGICYCFIPLATPKPPNPNKHATHGIKNQSIYSTDWKIEFLQDRKQQQQTLYNCDAVADAAGDVAAEPLNLEALYK